MGGTAALKTPIWVIPYRHQPGSQMAGNDTEIREYSMCSTVSNSKLRMIVWNRLVAKSLCSSVLGLSYRVVQKMSFEPTVRGTRLERHFQHHKFPKRTKI